MTKLEQAQVQAKMGEAIANDRAEGPVTDDHLDDARAAWGALKTWMDENEMVFYRL